MGFKSWRLMFGTKDGQRGLSLALVWASPGCPIGPRVLKGFFLVIKSKGI
jgi:hypothetical protein